MEEPKTEPKVRMGIYRQILFAKGKIAPNEILALVGCSLNAVVQEVRFLGEAGYLQSRHPFVDFGADNLFWIENRDKFCEYALEFDRKDRENRARALIVEACHLIGQDTVKEILGQITRGTKGVSSEG